MVVACLGQSIYFYLKKNTFCFPDSLNDFSDDRLVALIRRNHTYPTKQNVNGQLTYPETPEQHGATITFVNIIVKQVTYHSWNTYWLDWLIRNDFFQTSHNGDFHILNGGIGQRSISIRVDATKTALFGIEAYIYGVWNI